MKINFNCFKTPFIKSNLVVLERERERGNENDRILFSKKKKSLQPYKVA